MKGYWNKPEATAEAISADGWFRTGDIGRVDEDGYYYIVDRKKDLIIRGGYNVYPREIEEVLYEHPAVAEAAVVGMPHPELGEEVGAAVALKPGATVDAGRAARATSRRRSRPTSTRGGCGFVDALPKGPTGKILKREITVPDAEATAMTTSTAPSVTPEEAAVLADQAAPLDALLIDAALGSARRFVPDLSTAKLACRTRPQPAHHCPAAGWPRRRGGPDRDRHVDRRARPGATAASPTRRGRRTRCCAGSLQALPGGGADREQLVDDAELDWRDEQRMRFLTENLVEALAPSNVPLVNPASAKAVIDSAGLNLVRGGAQFVRDMASPPRIPEMVDRSAFEVGRNIAVTPGAVVLRTEVFELIQYAPQTEQVREVPLLVVPPTINKYYALDLAPDRSLVEFLVARGPAGVRHVLAQPGRPARRTGTSTPTCRPILDALDAVERITGSATAPCSAGVCSGGILASIDRRLPRGDRPAGPAGRLRPGRDRASTTRGPAWRRRSSDQRLAEPRPRRCPRAAATWTAGRWPRCSPGCGPAT